MVDYEITQQDISVVIGAIGLYMAWRSSHNLSNVLDEITSQIPMPSI